MGVSWGGAGEGRRRTWADLYFWQRRNGIGCRGWQYMGEAGRGDTGAVKF